MMLVGRSAAACLAHTRVYGQAIWHAGFSILTIMPAKRPTNQPIVRPSVQPSDRTVRRAACYGLVCERNFAKTNVRAATTRWHIMGICCADRRGMACRGMAWHGSIEKATVATTATAVTAAAYTQRLPVVMAKEMMVLAATFM
ncbi:unnamed protein product [Ceratitis capitata]|uniref:(Mediterranean fruit fly) hypothetical protein n=1 Tax=Ceratitis capitata TaxID=7213 RepID=A0A811UTY1_CERCA|nr:unnamed protein product [Ceratitis capitata]